MSQPSPERPALDSFLPQFAATTDKHPSQPSESNGAAHSSYLNGHLSQLETIEINGHDEGVSRFDVEEAPVQDVRNGVPDAAAPVNSLSSPLHSTNGAAHTNGAAAAEVVDQPTSSIDHVEAAPEIEDHSAVHNGVDSPTACERGPSSLTEHPAAGSLFTPYLVTEIRELRVRSRRRSWWRRLFG